MGSPERAFFLQRVMRKLALLAEAESQQAVAVSTIEQRTGATILVLQSGPSTHIYGEWHSQGPTKAETLLIAPGEHHALLPCPMPMPASFVVAQGGWYTMDDTLGAALATTEEALLLGSRDWRWFLTGSAEGDSFQRAEWCVQVRPQGRFTHLVMRGAQPLDKPGDRKNNCGFGLFRHIGWYLANFFARANPGPGAPFFYATALSDFALERFAEPPPAPVEKDAAPIVSSVLQRMNPDLVTIGEIPSKRAAIVKRVLGNAAHQVPIVGVIGSTGFLSSNNGVVLTPTRAIVRFDDVGTSFAWSDLTSAFLEKDGDICYAVTRSRGMIPIDIGKAGQPMVDAFVEIARQVAVSR